MTREADINALNEVVQLVLEEGMDGLGAAVSILLNEAMKIERSRALRARPWERTEERRGYANGYKDRTVKTRLGKLELKVPQVRGDVEFHPSALERGQRSERALKQALAQMYVQGVSTRKVTRIVETMCGTNVSASEVSPAKAGSGGLLRGADRRRNRRRRTPQYFGSERLHERSGTALAPIPAKFERARDARCEHQGLKAALRATFPGIPWQRCQGASAEKRDGLRTQIAHETRSRPDHPRHLQRPEPRGGRAALG